MKKTFLALALAVVFGASSAPAAERALVVYYIPRPPFYLTGDDGRPRGIIVDIAKEVFWRARVAHRFKEAPCKRIIVNLKRKEYACGIGWFKKPEREAFARFSAPIYRDRPLVAVVNKKKAARLPPKPTLNRLLDSGLTIGVIDGFSYGPWADEGFERFKPKMEVVTGSQQTLLRMMALGRFDYALINAEEAEWRLENDPGLSARLEIKQIADAPEGNLRHIMFSLAVEKEVIERINAAIAGQAKD